MPDQQLPLIKDKNLSKKWIVFQGGDEIIITDKKRRDECILQYFTEGCRNLEDYDEEVIEDCGLRFYSRVFADYAL